MNLKFSDFQFAFCFFTVLEKIKPDCMSGLFCILNLLEVGRKKHFMDFHCRLTKRKQNILIMKRKDIETRKKAKSKEKIDIKFSIEQKQLKTKLPTKSADIW